MRMFGIWLELECALVADPQDEAVAAAAARFGTLEGRTLAELAALGVASWMADTAHEATALARRALAGGILVRALDTAEPWFLAAWMLIRADHLDESAGVVEEALGHSRATGSQGGFARSSWLRAEIDHRRGDLLSAEANARSAFTIASQGGSLWVRLMSGALLAQVLADRGHLNEAYEIVGTLDVSMLPPTERLTRTVHYGRAYVALLAGRPTEAIAEFDHLNDSVPESPAWRHASPRAPSSTPSP